MPAQDFVMFTLIYIPHMRKTEIKRGIFHLCDMNFRGIYHSCDMNFLRYLPLVITMVNIGIYHLVITMVNTGNYHGNYHPGKYQSIPDTS